MAVHHGTERRFGANLRVLITGAGSGIGLACARAFAEQGAEQILSDIDGASLEAAASAFDALGRFCDVTSEASVAVFTAEVMKSYPSLDVLINAAGKSYVRNLGTMRITRAFLPMMKSDGGKKDIVTIAPMGEATAEGCPFPYAASREAFDRLTDALAENIRGTKIALTTIVPRLPADPHDDRSSAKATSLAPGTHSRQLETFSTARVAAAVVAAVRSKATRPGAAIILSAHAVSQFPDRWQAAVSRAPRPRMRGR